MERNWVDFKAIKQAVSLQQVLAHYQVKLKRSGKELLLPAEVVEKDAAK